MSPIKFNIVLAIIRNVSHIILVTRPYPPVKCTHFVKLTLERTFTQAVLIMEFDNKNFTLNG